MEIFLTQLAFYVPIGFMIHTKIKHYKILQIDVLVLPKTCPNWFLLNWGDVFGFIVR